MPETDGVPDVFADFVQISTGDMGIFLGFRAINPLDPEWPQVEGLEETTDPPIPTMLKAVVRLNLSEAKAFAILLKRSLLEYEEEHGLIPLSALLENHSEFEGDW